MTSKEQERSKKSIAAEVIHSEKASEIFNHIQKIKEKIKDTVAKGKEINSSELLEFINRFSDEMDYIMEELMRQDIRVATTTGLIELHPYPVYWKVEKQRLEEVNKEIEERIKSKNFPH